MIEESGDQSTVPGHAHEKSTAQIETKPVRTMGATHEHVFNDDLLINDHDLEYARLQFPQVIHVLDHPLLRAKFLTYDKEANQARDIVRGLGLIAVVAATLSLVVLATTPLWPHAYWTRWVAVIMEMGGMVGALIATGGLWLGPWKRRWLESRLMTERLRQWHFQLMVRRGQQIDASCKGQNAVGTFERDRDQWLSVFLKAYEGKLDEKLADMASELGDTGVWLHNSERIGIADAKVLDHLFDAYKELRFDHQYGYAVYKLQKSTDRPIWQFLKWPAICQVTVLSALVSVCIVGALIFSLVLIFGNSFGIDDRTELYARAGAIVIALVGVALRTLQDGLAPSEEIERFNDYRARTLLLRDRFRHATDTKEKFHLLEEMELASVDEMRRFLRTHLNSRFVLT